MALEFRCRDVGVVCRGNLEAETADELLAKIAEHAAREHHVPELSQTLVDYARTKIRES